VGISLLHRDFVVYPESDGEPTGETGLHVRAAMQMIAALDRALRHKKDVCVGGNQFMYFREGDPKQVVCPDAYAAFGTDPAPRRTWKVWEEKGRFPELIVEIVSESSRQSDDRMKRGLYEALFVREYYLFDPERLGPGPHLWGYQRQGDRLVPMAAKRLPGGEVRLRSRLLGHWVESDGALLRLREVRTGEPVLHTHELADAHEQRAAELARLRKLLPRLPARRSR
jgi:Uma2 family endonuclease